MTDNTFKQDVAAVTLDLVALDYAATNVLHSRGSLPKSLRRDAVIAIRTLRAILDAARDEPDQPTPKDHDHG